MSFIEEFARLRLCLFHYVLCWNLAKLIIIHQTHYEKSDWSRAFNQFTIAGELDMQYLQQILHLSCQVQRLPGY